MAACAKTRPAHLRSPTRILLPLFFGCILILASCATVEDQRFPLDYVAGQRAALKPGTAQEALVAYQQIGSRLEAQGRVGDAAATFSNAYTSARALGRLQEALALGQKAVAMAERAGTPKHLAPALNRLGQVYLDLNAPHRAIPILEEAARHARAGQDPNNEASSYMLLGRAYRNLRRPDLAAESTEKALALVGEAR